MITLLISSIQKKVDMKIFTKRIFSSSRQQATLYFDWMNVLKQCSSNFHEKYAILIKVLHAEVTAKTRQYAIASFKLL